MIVKLFWAGLVGFIMLAVGMLVLVSLFMCGAHDPREERPEYNEDGDGTSEAAGSEEVSQ